MTPPHDFKQCRRVQIFAGEIKIKAKYYSYLIFLIVGSLLSAVAIAHLSGNMQFIYQPLHSTMEALGMFAGLLSLSAAWRLILDYRYLREPRLYRLAVMALLFGLAGITFAYSSPWSGTWWFWHAIRVAAYFLVLWFIYADSRRNLVSLQAALARGESVEQELLKAHEELESRIKERTVALEKSNKRLRLEVAERKQMEESLKESEERYRTLVESSDDNIAILNREFYYEYVNEKAVSRLKTEPSAVIGKHMKEIFPENYEQLISDYEKVLESGKVSGIITLVKFPVGELWMDLKLIPIRVENGKANALMVVARDITKVKNEEMELEKSHQVQYVLNSLLALSLKDISLDKQLERAIDIILAAPLMQIMPKGAIFLIEDGSNELVLKASRNLPLSLQKMCGKVPFGECLCGRAAASGRMIFSAEVDHRHEHRYEGMVPHGHYNIPILARAKKGKVLGVVALYLQEGHRREKREEEFLQSVANTLAIMIERKKQEEKLRTAKELSDALNAINTTITSTFDFEKIMERVTEEATVAIGCESGRILLRDGQEWLVKYVYGFAPEPPDLRLNDDEARTTVLAAQTGTVVAVNDAYNDDRVNPELMRKYSTRSLMVVPLIAKDKIIGAMLFQYHSEPVGFNETQIDFAEKLAASVSLSMENARLYEEERNIADTLQEELLSVPDEIEGVNFGHLYRSATKTARVGGDFYDIFELQGGRIGILVGDVSGKGIEAAVVTSTAKSTLKAFSFEENSPAEIIGKTNDLVMKVIGEGLFITIFFGILDRNTGILTYCSAGHPEAIIKKGRETSFLATDSPAMVPMARLKYIDNKENLGKDDILVLYTDGVTEARNSDREFFGDKRLLKFVEDFDVKSVKELPNLVLNDLIDFTGGTLNDDIAILTVSISD